MKLIRSMRNRESISYILTYLVLFWSALGVGLQIIRSAYDINPLESILVTQFYFTTQSNIIIFLVSLTQILKPTKGKIFKLFAFIGLVNISLTGIIFHILLTPFMSHVSFLNHVLHTINPLLYILFYFICIHDYVPIKRFYYSLLYPLFYMVFVYTIVSPIFGDMLERVVTTFESARYVYPFLDPRTYNSGVSGLLLFNLGLLAPLIAIFAFLLAYLKVIFEQKFHTKEKEETQVV